METVIESLRLQKHQYLTEFIIKNRLVMGNILVKFIPIDVCTVTYVLFRHDYTISHKLYVTTNHM